MEGFKILITGGSGFIGKNLARDLGNDNDVTVLDIHCDERLPVDTIKFVKDDVRNKDWFTEIGNVDYIFHLAALVGVDNVAVNPQKTADTEIEGIKRVVEFARNNNAKVIYSSTSSVYDIIDSPTMYNSSKMFAEQYLVNSGVQYSIARLFNVYGKHQESKMVVARFLKRALENQPLFVYGSGNQTRDFTFIEDVVEALKFLAESKACDRKTLDVCRGAETPIKELAKYIIEATGSLSQIKLCDAPSPRKPYETMQRKGNPEPLKQIGFECKISLGEGLLKSLRTHKTTILASMKEKNRGSFL